MPRAILLYRNDEICEKTEIEYGMSKPNTKGSCICEGCGTPLIIDGNRCTYQSDFGGEYYFVLPDCYVKEILSNPDTNVYHDNNTQSSLKRFKKRGTYIVRLIFTNKNLHDRIQIVFSYGNDMVPIDVDKEMIDDDIYFQRCISRWIK